jgi:predicted CxxxxCH...CXXCH cytochrome family protein
MASEAKYGDDGRITDDPLKYKFNCGNCHPMDRAKHANGTVDVELYNASATGFKTNTPPSASRTGTGTATICNDVYCHSNGADGANRAYRSTPQWGSTFPGNKCAGCHDDPPRYTGQSHYTQNGFMGREGGHLVGIHFDNIKSGTWGLIQQGGSAGSGAAHGDPNTSTTISCNICHAATVVSAGQQSAPGTPFACANCHALPQSGSIADKTMHVNGVRDVVFMSGALRAKAQLGDASFTSILQPLGWTRNNGYKLAPDSHDSITFSGSYNAGSKTCVTACHLNQPAIWGDTTVTCVSCHGDL